jgi:hypothetical protein
MLLLFIQSVSNCGKHSESDPTPSKQLSPSLLWSTMRVRSDLNCDTPSSVLRVIRTLQKVKMQPINKQT